MADHPLRPATDHCLGGPLPHQLANPTRAPPVAINLSRFPGLCGISRSFPRLSPTTGQVPTRYSPVRHSRPAETGQAFDLHVLGMPPAFVLSQDQTLKFIPDLLSYSKVDPNKGLQTFANARTNGGPRPPSAHPFPLLHNLNQQSPGLPTTRGRAYKPTRHPRQHPIGIRVDSDWRGSFPTRCAIRRFVRRIVGHLVGGEGRPRKGGTASRR